MVYEVIRMNDSFIDPFGDALLKYHQTGNGTYIVERDDGYLGTFDTGEYFADYHDWPKLDKIAMDFARGKCLDVGCGAGRHSLYLQQNGFDVLATDKSPMAIEVCRRRGIHKCGVAPAEELWMSAIVNGFRSVNTVFLLGYNLGLLGSYRLAKIILDNLYTLTTDDAVVVGTCCDPYKTNDPSNILYHQSNIKRGRMAGQSRFRIRHGKDAGEWFDYLYISRRELDDIASNSGWVISNFIWGEENETYLAVLSKWIFLPNAAKK